MSRTNASVTVASAALAAIALAIGTAALGQTSSAEKDVTVDASKIVVIRHGHPRHGIAKETVQLSEQVSFADLDLATEAGESELHRRIEATATAICKQLGALHPAGTAQGERMTRADCVKRAVDDTAEQTKQAIAAAHEGEHPGEPGTAPE